jgi:cyclic lactone autoinducer peptide
MKNLKKAIAKTTGKAFEMIAEVFSTMSCMGRLYEPKMPVKLKK